MTCPLCQSNDTHLFFEEIHKQWGKQTYFQCRHCQLTFLDPSLHLNPEEEKKRYDLHQNEAGDQDYVNFLKILANPLKEYLKPGDKGLDFGCGPGPVMSMIFQEWGHKMDNYDPYFANYSELLNKQYDFITCSETAEHFYNPTQAFQTLRSMLKPKGYLGIMTSFFTENIDFAAWHYRHDPAHVSFYHKNTFKWIAQSFGWEVNFPAKNVVIFQNI